MTLNVGVIGFGARAAIAALVESSSVPARITDILDVAERGRADAHAMFPKASVHAELDAMPWANLDAVLICTPDDQHAGPATTALEHGVAVFVEKPVAVTIEDADAVLETAFRSGSRLYVGHNMRHMPVIRLMRELIQSGSIGEVKAVWCRHFVGHGGDFYFKDWHADRARTTGLLLQKGAHDIDVIHWLAGSQSVTASGMGSLAVYGSITDRRDRSGERMRDWFSLENWPPASLTGLNPTIDVEDLSMVHLQLSNGVLASYEQCHFTPDYWRNYTVIGTEGRIENFGDTAGSTVGLWNRRHSGSAAPDETFTVPEAEGTHGGADPLLIDEFLRFVAHGDATDTSPVAARDAVAAGVTATVSMRTQGGALPVPQLPAELVAYFDAGQRA